MKRTALRLCVTALVGLPLLLAVVVMASRVGDRARFVMWPVVGFTVLAALVAVIGVWTGLRQPSTLVTGLLPAIGISYFLPAAPLPLVAAALIVLAVLASAVRGVPCGIAAGAGTLMVLFVVMQGPAVECGPSSVSSSGGPWWMDEPSHSSEQGSSTADGVHVRGTVQVGEGHYRYACANGRLTSFERVAE